MKPVCFFEAALSLALLAGSALAQSTGLLYPPPESKLTVGDNFTVQVAMGSYPENIDVVAIVIGLNHCYGGCSPPSEYMGSILYQGPYSPKSGNYYENYTVTVPRNTPTGAASLNVMNIFMVGEQYEPITDYLSENVIVVQSSL